MKNIVIVGKGSWGKKIIDTLQYDLQIIPTIATRDNWKDLIDKKPEGVIIATPPSSHIEIAEFSLSRQIPTFIEKPLALTLSEAQKLSKYKDVPILVNHIHLFSEQFSNLVNIIHASNQPIDQIASIGCNNGAFRDYSSLFDYGCHDIAMILYLVGYYSKMKLPNINIEQVKTDIGELYKIDLIFDNFTSQSLIGNGAKHKIRKFKVICNGISVIYNDVKNRDKNSPLYHALNTFLYSIDNGIHDDRLGVDLSIQTIKILENCQALLKKDDNQFQLN